MQILLILFLGVCAGKSGVGADAEGELHGGGGGVPEGAADRAGQQQDVQPGDLPDEAGARAGGQGRAQAGAAGGGGRPPRRRLAPQGVRARAGDAPGPRGQARRPPPPARRRPARRQELALRRAAARLLLQHLAAAAVHRPHAAPAPPPPRDQFADENAAAAAANKKAAAAALQPNILRVDAQPFYSLRMPPLATKPQNIQQKPPTPQPQVHDPMGNLKRTRSGNAMDKAAAAAAGPVEKEPINDENSGRRKSLSAEERWPELPDHSAFDEALVAAVLAPVLDDSAAAAAERNDNCCKPAPPAGCDTSPAMKEKIGKRLRIFQDITQTLNTF